MWHTANNLFVQKPPKLYGIKRRRKFEKLFWNVCFKSSKCTRVAISVIAVLGIRSCIMASHTSVDASNHSTPILLPFPLVVIAWGCPWRPLFLYGVTHVRWRRSPRSERIVTDCAVSNVGLHLEKWMQRNGNQAISCVSGSGWTTWVNNAMSGYFSKLDPRSVCQID